MKMRKLYKKKMDGVQIVSTAAVLLLTIIVFIPFWNAVVISFETSSAAAKYPFSWIPKDFTLDNYKELFGKGTSLLKSYWMTLKITFWGTLLGMAISVMGAYGFSRNFPGKKLFFRLAMFTMFFGGGLVPTYLQYRNMGLLNEYGCIIIGLVSVYNVIIMKNGFESVPMDLQEAAMLDGAHDMQIFYKVMLPLQKPLIATFSLFTIVGYWNSWYWPMILMTNADASVLQLFLRKILNSVDSEMAGAIAASKLSYATGMKMASIFLVMFPVMVIYPFLQKYFTKGIMVGAVKM